MKSEYQNKMDAFLRSANATCKIEYGGIARNQDWDNQKRNWYDVTIETPKGKMQYVFWDSIHDTEIYTMTLEKYVTKIKHSRIMSYGEKIKAQRELNQLKAEAIPNTYDVIDCLEKYDVGTFEDFCSEFGYDEDSRRAERIYIAVVKEFKELQKIFSEEQLEILRDIDNYEYVAESEMEMF